MAAADPREVATGMEVEAVRAAAEGEAVKAVAEAAARAEAGAVTADTRNSEHFIQAGVEILRLP